MQQRRPYALRATLAEHAKVDKLVVEAIREMANCYNGNWGALLHSRANVVEAQLRLQQRRRERTRTTKWKHKEP